MDIETANGSKMASKALNTIVALINHNVPHHADESLVPVNISKVNDRDGFIQYIMDKLLLSLSRTMHTNPSMYLEDAYNGYTTALRS